MAGNLRPVLLAVLSAWQGAWGSGSYVYRPITVAAHDAARYELGKAIFTGKGPLKDPHLAAAERESQSRRLHELQRRLPVKARSTPGLPELAGRLTPGQLAALEYYLKIRYKVQ